MKTRRFLLRGLLILLGAALPLNAQTLIYEYGTDGRIAAVHLGEGRTIFYHHDPAGNITRIHLFAIIDTDQDGLDDDWERTHFGDLTRDGTGDFDQDGASDAAEFLANTNPADPASVFKASPPELQPEDTVIRFNSVAGKRYRLFYKESLADAQWEPLGEPIVATGTISVAVDPGPRDPGKRFYRLEVIP